MYSATLPTPVGPLTVTSNGTAITRVTWDGTEAQDTRPELTEALLQLGAYFAGSLKVFDLPLAVEAPDFQASVCEVMQSIPYGETLTYGDIARCLGVPAQAVGQACGGNPIPVIIPCHRVLGASSLGGYSGEGGVETKVWLLRHEGAAGLLI
ncbi:MAG: methylated-DNA--[protein]-cysteine S-methyltransferase [Roseovarius sp.]